MSLSLFPAAEDYPLPPPPEWMQSALMLIACLSILLPAGPIRLSSGLPIASLIWYMIFWTEAPTRSAYLAGISNFGVLVRWTDLVAFHTPERDFWKVKRDAKGVVVAEERIPERGLWRRFWWWANLWNNARSVGWNIQAPSLPASLPPDYPRFLFVRQCALRAFKMYIGLDISQILLRSTRPLGASFFAAQPAHQVFVAWNTAFKLYYTIELLYYVGALVTVLVGIYGPADWPPITGSFRRQAWSVRKMWGTCWHQMMRRPCAEAGRGVTKVFGLKKGSFASKYSQVWVGFAVSAGVHHVGAVTGAFGDGGWTQFVYFAMQPVGIMIEDGVIELGKRYGVKGEDAKKYGFTWVVLWFSFWLRYMVASNPASWSQELAVPSLLEYAYAKYKLM